MDNKKRIEFTITELYLLEQLLERVISDYELPIESETLVKILLNKIHKKNCLESYYYYQELPEHINFKDILRK